MKKRYLLLIIPVIIIAIVLILNKRPKNVSIKDASYDSAYTKLALNILKNKMNDETITNYEDGNTGEMYVTHPGYNYDWGSEITDYRFRGSNPNNYVYFNCSNPNDTSTCEIWRIIGIIPFKAPGTSKIDYKIEIMRDEYIGQFAYDTNGTVNWNTATLKDYLNNDYYNSLSISAKNMISSVKYYICSIGYEESVPYNESYSRERSCYRSWEGKVAIPYPSDYYNAMSWMHTSGNMSLLNNKKGIMHSIINNEGEFSDSSPTTENNIKPVLHLNSDIYIFSGNGTRENPYLFLTKEDMSNLEYDYKIGDEIYYNNELYYVIENSLNESDYVAVFKDIPLKEKYTNLSKEDDPNAIGYLQFDYSNTCYYKNILQYDYSGCTNNFNTSYIKSFLNKWAEDEFNDGDLVEVDGNKIRLITFDEIKTSLKYDLVERQGISDTYYILTFTEQTPEFTKNRNYSCWTMSQYEDSNGITTFSNNIYKTDTYRSACVEPVVNIKKESIGNQTEYHIGDYIKYKDIDYYVISDSSSNVEYVTAIKIEPLTKAQIKKYEKNADTSNNVGNTVYMNYNSQLTASYENSDVRKIIESWLDKTFDDEDLATVNGFRARLISTDELFEKLFFEYINQPVGSNGYNELNKTDNTPNWAYSYSYWTETPREDDDKYIFVMTNYGIAIEKNITSLSAVRPIVYLKKSAIGKVSSKYTEDEEDIPINSTPKKEKTCTPKYKKETITHYSTYNIGDEITYKGDKYHVINNSDNQTNYITILKDELFKNKEYNDNLKNSIRYYFKRYYRSGDNIQSIEYYKTEQCTQNNQSECRNDYESTIIKKIIENWIKVEFDETDLINVDGYKARLLAKNDLEKLGYTFDNDGTQEIINGDRNMYPWIFASDYSNFWGMTETPNNTNKVLAIRNGYNVVSWDVYNSFVIRPIINLNKSLLGEKTDYYVGEEVTYENELYNVLENTDASKEYVVLLKKKPLTDKQVENYKDLNYDEFSNELLDKPYNIEFYTSDNCKNDYNNKECRNDYEHSKIKKFIDEWIKENDIEKDLIEVNGYKARLLNAEDLFDNLNYTDEKYRNYEGTRDIYITNMNVPEWIAIPNSPYWTMISNPKSTYNTHYQVNNYSTYVVLENGYIGGQIFGLNYNRDVYVYDQFAIRPVLNLNKCVIEGACQTEEIEIEDGCMEDGVTILDNIANTLSSASKYIIILSVLSIVIGCGVFGYNYYKSRKERK